MSGGLTGKQVIAVIRTAAKWHRLSHDQIKVVVEFEGVEYPIRDIAVEVSPEKGKIVMQTDDISPFRISNYERGRTLPEGFDPIVPVEEGERLRVRSMYGTLGSIMGMYFYEVVRERLHWVIQGVSYADRTPEDALRWAKQSAKTTQRNHRIRDEKRAERERKSDDEH